MNKISAIMAIDSNGAIGKGDSLLIKDKVDQAFFAGYTMGKTCIVGYNTFKTLPKLKGRDVVLDTKHTLDLKWGVFNSPISEIVVIGGAKTYHKYSSQIEELHITKFDYSLEEGDVKVDLSLFDHLDRREIVFKGNGFVIEKWK